MKKIRTGIFVCLVLMMSTGTAGAVKRERPVHKEDPETSAAAPSAPVPNLRVSIYKVETNGFSLNGSEVKEINRLALQACFDAGLKCSARDMTADNVQKEQAYGGKGKIAESEYIAEFTLSGSEEDAVKIGIPGGINIGGGYAHPVGGGWIGAGGYTDLSGLGIRLSRMTLTSQFTNTSDGTLGFSKTDEKMGLSGKFLIGEVTSSNAKKLLKSFREVFEEFKERNR